MTTRFRRLLPEPADDVDPLEAYEIPTDRDATRPFVRCNMITSLDGAISVRGRSGMLGGPADRELFGVLRALTDVVLVGAGTVRAEGYGPARIDDEHRRRRQQRGQDPVPPIAVVTRSCRLDWSTPFFTEAKARPIVITSEDGSARCRDAADPVADVIVAGDDDVDLQRALDALGERGHRSVLLEGGPGLNAQMVAAGALDELCLTLAPRLVAGDGPRLLAGDELPEPLDLHTLHVLEADGLFFHRLAVRR